MRNCGVRNNIIPNRNPDSLEEDASIMVYRISFNGEKGGYIDIDFDRIIETLRDIEVGDSYTFSKERIPAAKYLSLPEFEGF